MLRVSKPSTTALTQIRIYDPKTLQVRSCRPDAHEARMWRTVMYTWLTQTRDGGHCIGIDVVGRPQVEYVVVIN